MDHVNQILLEVPTTNFSMMWAMVAGLAGTVATVAGVAWKSLKDQNTYLKDEIGKKDERLVAAERDAMSTLTSLTQYLESIDKDRNRDKEEILTRINDIRCHANITGPS